MPNQPKLSIVPRVCDDFQLGASPKLHSSDALINYSLCPIPEDTRSKAEILIDLRGFALSFHDSDIATIP